MSGILFFCVGIGGGVQPGSVFFNDGILQRNRAIGRAAHDGNFYF
jgi:hypothetical protein